MIADPQRDDVDSIPDEVIAGTQELPAVQLPDPAQAVPEQPSELADAEANPLVDVLRKLVHGRTIVDRERQILGLLEQASPDELNHYLADAALNDQLLNSLDNHLFGPAHHRDLLELLHRRHEEFALPVKAAVIRALATGRTPRRAEELITAIICATVGEQLTALKNLINGYGDVHDLESIVFVDLENNDLRDRILDHIASNHAAHTGEVKIISDIDDTTICALHDKRFPKGIVYPGVLAFWEALDHGPRDEPVSMGDLTFVTARPGDILGLVEGRTRTMLAEAGAGANAVLTGSLLALLSKGRMATKKLDNINHYHRLFPEYDLVFVGDSGQGDVIVGDELNERFPDAARRVLIHDVIDTSADERARQAARGVHFFDTYVGAGKHVHDAGLISDAGLRAIVDAVQAGFDKVEWESVEQEEATRRLLAADLAAVGS